MFGRRKGERPATPAVTERPGAKNRPTPKRSVAEQANKRPLVPGDRKVAAKSSREQLREQRIRQRQAMMTGDERYLPARDQGAEKRYVRDFIDARWNVGEFMLPLVVLVFALTLTRSGYIILVVTLLVYGLILGAIFDALYLRIRLRRLLTAKFGAMPKGTVFYAVTRSLQIRRWRMPRPQVARGQYPA